MTSLTVSRLTAEALAVRIAAPPLLIRGRAMLSIWMQTNGMFLLAAKRCSPVCVLPAQDSRSAQGLLYFPGVRGG